MDEQFLITGAARGLGLAMTRQLLERGFRVSALVRAESDGLRDLRVRYGEHLGIHVADVSDEALARDRGARHAARSRAPRSRAPRRPRSCRRS